MHKKEFTTPRFLLQDLFLFNGCLCVGQALRMCTWAIADAHKGLRLWISPGAGAGASKHVWASWHGWWKLNLEPLYEKYVFLIIEPPLQPQEMIFFSVVLRPPENIIAAHVETALHGGGWVLCMGEESEEVQELQSFLIRIFLIDLLMQCWDLRKIIALHYLLILLLLLPLMETPFTGPLWIHFIECVT